MSNRDKKDRRLASLEQSQPTIPEFSIMAAFRKGPLPPPEEMQKFKDITKRADKAQRNSFLSFIFNSWIILFGFIIYRQFISLSLPAVDVFLLTVTDVSFCPKTAPAIINKMRMAIAFFMLSPY